MSENEDIYHDTVLDLEAKAKENENVDFVPQKELSAEQKYFSSTFIPFEKHSNASTSTSPSETKPSVASMPSSNLMKLYMEKMENEFTTLFALIQTNSKRESIFYTTPKEKRLTKFCQQEVKPILHELHLNFEIFQKRFSEDIKEMKDVFELTESDLSATWKQNKFLNDQLLEAKLKHEIDCCVLLSHKCVNDTVQNEIEKIQRDSIEIQEGMQKRIDILGNDVQRRQKQKVRAQNQDLLITISELKAKLKHVEKAISSVRRPLNRDSSFKNSVLSNTKKSSEKVEVSDRTNKKIDVASMNVALNKKIVTDVDVKNALIAKNVVQIVLRIVDSGCSKHMIGDRSLLKNFVEKFLGDDLLIRARESNLYTISISDMVASSPVCLLSKATSTKSWLWHHILSHINFGTINDLTKHDLVDGLSKFKYGKDHLCSTCERGKSKKSSHPPKLVLKSMNIPSKEDLDNLFGPMYEEYFEKRSSKVSINSATQQVHNHEDSPSTSSTIVEEHEAPPIVTTSEEQTSPILMNEVDELNQEDSTEFDGNTLLTPYDTPEFAEAESSIALDPSNMHDFHQVQPSTHIWTKAHPLEQVIGDPSKPVMTRKRLQTDSELCMYALTVNTFEPKNIKEAMSDHIWIESMQDELHQFKRLDVWELVPRLYGKNIIAVKWLWKNKNDA
ncbi:integrase, catalytic region, zinc finger, CCHC-type containing protein [Tanacetum coccineum]